MSGPASISVIILSLSYTTGGLTLVVEERGRQAEAEEWWDGVGDDEGVPVGWW